LIKAPLKGWKISNVWKKLNKPKFYSREITSRLKPGNTCFHSAQNLLSSGLLSKNLKIKIYRTIILNAVLYGCETWSFTLREEFMLRVLRGIFGPKGDGVAEKWKKRHNENLNDLYSSLNIARVIKWRRMGERRGVCRVLVLKPEGKSLLLRPGVDGRIILKCVLRKWDVRAWTGSIQLRAETVCGHL
jgi:hypothetical protein